jgi:hypothetical protein
VSYGVGQAPKITGLSPFTSNIVLSPSNLVVTLDYGSEVLGDPFVDIKGLSQCQFELKYSEEFASLNAIYGDGPFVFANHLSNTFRTKTFALN